MKLLLHILMTLTIAAVIGLVAMYWIDVRRDESQRMLTRAALGRFQQQIHLQTALASAEGALAKPPASVDPKWFEDERPNNVLLGPDHPWVEIADERDRDYLHPHNLVAGESSIAGFWYNPYQGIVRARVPQGVSDATVLKLYNEINDCTLESIFPDREE